MKPKYLEGVPHLGQQTADLDVTTRPANLFDETHEYSQPGRGDVPQLFTVDNQTMTSAHHLILYRRLELGRGMRINKTFQPDQ